MKIDFNQIINGLLMGFGAGFGWTFAMFILSKF
jgi:hypothetical protein